MFNNAQYFRVGEASQVNTGNYYAQGSSNVNVHDDGYYSQTVGVTAQNAYFSNGDGRTTIKDLQQHIVEDALHNSDQRCDAPACYPETRKAVQADILSWITNGYQDDEPKKIMWLSGPAGSGKTAIAGSIAETCEEEGLLAGSFFFSCFRGAVETSSKRGVVATMAYSFLQHESLQCLQFSILSSIDKDPSIFRRRLREQCKTLLLRPFHLLRSALDQRSIPQVIILDGVDEIKAALSRNTELIGRQADEADQLEVLSALLQAAQDPRFPFRILVVSRPERVIQEFFATQANHITRQLHLDKDYNADSDIALFLRAKLSRIRHRYGLPASWANDGVVEKLVNDASGQFVYADTVIRFLESADAGLQVRLDCVLGLDARRDVLRPFAKLDALYTHIIHQSPDPILAAEWIRHIGDDLTDDSAFFLRHSLEEEVGQSYRLLENLSSLLYTPPADDLEGQYELYHKSLIDFLQDSKRSVAFPEPLQEIGDFKEYFRFARIMLRKKIYRSLEFHLARCYLPAWLGTVLMESDAFWWMNTANIVCPRVDGGSTDAGKLARVLFSFVHLGSASEIFEIFRQNADTKEILFSAASPVSSYASLLSLVDAMYARLPDGWKEEYAKEMEMEGVTRYNVCEALISQIEREVQSSHCNLVDDPPHGTSFHPLFDNLVDPSDPSFDPALDALFKSIFD
ncbi:hypothetical protein NMY22_g6485 [Coprinellus aureogranulatus]|nr:hypothetical protein NMY22_g6485 [Coprinellus aureogranulatus]